MPELTLYGRSIATVFDLLGDKENDLTYSVGWGLAQGESFAKRLLDDVFPGVDAREVRAVRLQEFLPGSGFTDIELESERVAIVLEAKRGWSLPSNDQLEQYAPRLAQIDVGRILVVSECSPEFAEPSLPQAVDGVPVVYRSWKQIVHLAEDCAPKAQAEKRILRELTKYLRGLMTMQKQTSNMVYVVSLGATRQSWSGSLTPIEIVTEKNVYFHPIGGGYPKEPPNYLGFRWNGRLQQIRHVEGYEVFTDPHEHLVEIPSQQWERHFVYALGPPIVPAKEVRTGNLFRAQRVEAALDLLLTCDTVRDARDQTQERLKAAGEVAV
jgi:hypothetical protein